MYPSRAVPGEALTMVEVVLQVLYFADESWVAAAERFTYRDLTHDRSSVSTSYAGTNLKTEQPHARPAHGSPKQ